MAILGPLGNPLVTLASDGVGVAMTNRTDDTFIVQADAEAGLRSLSGGALGLDDMWAVIVADLPVGARPPDAIRRSGPLVEFDYGVAEGAIVRVIADVRTHLPEALVILRGESELGRISWSEFMPSPGGPMPGKAVIEVHNVALRVDLDFKAWEAMVEVPEGLMSVVPPEGFTVTTFAEGFENMRGLDLPQE
jgi:hypothetical protein